MNYKYVLTQHAFKQGLMEFPQNLGRERKEGERRSDGRLEIVQKRIAREGERGRELQLLLFFSIQFHGGSVSLLTFASASVRLRRMMTLLLLELKKTPPLPSLLPSPLFAHKMMDGMRSEHECHREKERKEEHVRKEGKNMDRPPRPRLCFTHPEQNERERESERRNTRKKINCAGNWIGQSGRQEGGRAATQATPRHSLVQKT